MAKAREFEIDVRGEKQAVTGYVVGIWGVHKTGKFGTWVLTHLPTGFALPIASIMPNKMLAYRKLAELLDDPGWATPFNPVIPKALVQQLVSALDTVRATYQEEEKS